MEEDLEMGKSWKRDEALGGGAELGEEFRKGLMGSMISGTSPKEQDRRRKRFSLVQLRSCSLLWDLSLPSSAQQLPHAQLSPPLSIAGRTAAAPVVL